MDNAIEIIGWIGSLEVVIAYALISYTKTTGKSIVYQLLNLTGAIFLLINTILHGAFPASFVNAVWALIAIYALLRIGRQKKT